MKRLMRGSMIMPLALWALLLLGNAGTLTAQDQPAIYLLRDHALIAFDTEGTQQLAADLSALWLPDAVFGNPDHLELAQVKLNSGRDTLYILLHEGKLSAKLPFPTRTRLIAVDIATQTTRTLYERSGIFTFRLSPDELHMSVGYYEADYYFSAERTCILNLSEGTCSPLPHRIVLIPGDWVDNAHVLLPVSKDGGNYHMNVIDITTGAERSLPLLQGWNLNSGTPIPGTRSILVEADSRDLSQPPFYRFFVINIDTREAEMLPYSEDNSIIQWDFSPDNRYVLYGDTPATLVEFTTGRLIHQFDAIFQSGWIDEHTLVIRGRDDKDAAQEIALVDATTGHIDPLATGDQAGGILLIPSRLPNDEISDRKSP